MARVLVGEELTRQLQDLPEWVQEGAQITRTRTFDSFLDAIAAVQRVAVDADAMDHHPDMDVRWRKVTFTLSTHSEGGITQLDIELAHQIDGVIRDASG